MRSVRYLTIALYVVLILVLFFVLLGIITNKWVVGGTFSALALVLGLQLFVFNRKKK